MTGLSSDVSKEAISRNTDYEHPREEIPKECNR
jgi:hypothetical protein